MNLAKRTTTLVILGACLAAAAGCGEDDEKQGEPIPAQTASVLQKELDSVEARLDNGSVGACNDVFEHPTDPNVDPVNSAIAAMPDNVDADVRSALQEGFDTLFRQVGERCDELRQEAEQQQEPDPVETVEEPLPTETVEEPPTETETTPTTEAEPPPTETGDGGTPPDGEELPGDGGGAIAPEEDEG